MELRARSSTLDSPRRPHDPQAILIIVEYLIALAPYALCSLMAGAIASAADVGHVAADVALLVVAAAAVYGFHTLIVVPSLFMAVVRRNPWAFLAKFRYAYRKAFRTGSADEALDKTVEAAVESGEISSTVAGACARRGGRGGIRASLCRATPAAPVLSTCHSPRLAHAQHNAPQVLCCRWASTLTLTARACTTRLPCCTWRTLVAWTKT